MTAEPTRPAVSFVMPVLNEADSLADAVAAVLAQDYDGPKQLVLGLGPSRDGTTAIARRIAAADDRVVLVDNPGTDIPLGMNLAVAAATGDIVVRVDAHAVLPPDYTSRMVAVLERTGAANVGGVMRARGTGPLQRAVARAYNSPVGLGGGVYHGGGEEGPAESAYLGVFRRSVLDAVGGYDPTLRRAEDYELNQRIIAAGHVVWYVPDVEVTYWPRSSWSALARQMWATGTWRGELVRRRRRSGPRYLVAPALVVGLAGAAVTAVAELAQPPRWVRAGYAAPVAYAAFLAATALRGSDDEDGRDRLLDAGVLATIHLSWGAGFLKGFVAGAGTTVDRSRVTAPPAPPAG